MIASPVPLVRADGAGYTFAGEPVDGFDDRPELAESVRVRLARLGERYAPGKLSTAQRELLATPLAQRDAARQPSRDRPQDVKAAHNSAHAPPNLSPKPPSTCLPIRAKPASAFKLNADLGADLHQDRV
jgi:hypothetical protein